jgi:ATP/maltotriose-dependent transcriptional regulator MalT
VAAHLAEVVQAQGRHAEAARLAASARELADEDDVEAQALWRRVSAKALAEEGRLDEAERFAREATDILAPTDAPVMKADAFVDLAEVLQAKGDPERHEALAEACRLYELKGNVVAAARTRRLLADLVPRA